MAILDKEESTGTVTYTVVSSSGATYVYTLHKTTGFYMEIRAPWPVGGVFSWEDYAAAMESGHEVV